MTNTIVYTNGVTYNTDGSFGVEVVATEFGHNLNIRDFIHGVPNIPILITINDMTPDRLRGLGYAIVAAAGE